MRTPFSAWALAIIVLGGTAAGAQINDLYDLNAASSMGCWTQASNGSLYDTGSEFSLSTSYEQASSVYEPPVAFPMPSCSFIQGSDTNFYAWSGETISKLSLAGSGGTLYSLTAAQGQGIAAMIQANDGNFYGVASAGGTYADGSLFSITPAGVFKSLYNFTGGPDGGAPQNLLQGSDGNLYGSTSTTIFRSDLAGRVSTLANASLTGLVEGANGDLYGISSGGANLDSLTLSGILATVATISDVTASGVPGAQYQAFVPPCYVGGDTNIYCGVEGNEDDYEYGGIVGIAPDGDEAASVFIGELCNSTPSEFGTLTFSYAQAGDGNFYGQIYSTQAGEGDNCEASEIYSVSLALAAVQLTLTPSQVKPGEQTTLSWQAKNAFSGNMKQCFATGAWSGIQTPSGSVTGSAPSAPGVYRYALTCGGIETGAALLYVAVPQVTLSISPTTFAKGYPVTIIVTVKGNNGPATGKVAIMNGTQTLITLPLNSSGVATVTAPGGGLSTQFSYDLVASYPGSAAYAAAVSAPVEVTEIASPYTTETTLAASATTVSAGQSVTLTAQVDPTQSENVEIAGNVEFYSGNVLIGTVALSPGQYFSTASLTLKVPSLPAGNYGVTAVFPGTSTFASSSSSPVVLTVTGTPVSTLTLTASPNPVTPPAPLTLTAAESAAPGKPAPTGSVYSYYGATYLGASSLNGSGVATFPVSTTGLSAGTYMATADYNGDTNYTKTTATTSITVQ
jgi:uncharacterized repeat protein (TIGR03803 family)